MGNARSAHTQRWALAYAQRGHDVHVLSIRHAQLDGVAVHTRAVGPVNSPSPAWSFLSYLRLLLAASRTLRRLAPDVVHAHYSITHGVIAALSRFRPVVLSVWGKDVVFDAAGPRGWLLRILNRVALRSATAVTSTSDFMIPYVLKLAGQPLVVRKIPYGVDTDLFRPGTEERPPGVTIGFVKHLKPKYGPDDLLSAVDRIRPHIPELRVVMAGEGELLTHLTARAARLGVEDIIEFPGRLPHNEIPDLMRTFDILANPSVDPSESFGVAILEASSTAIPVVVTDVGGIREVARDEETALIVAPGMPDALADALLRLALDSELRAQLGRNGREFAKQSYEWRDNVSSMIEILQSVVQ